MTPGLAPWCAIGPLRLGSIRPSRPASARTLHGLPKLLPVRPAPRTGPAGRGPRGATLQLHNSTPRRGTRTATQRQLLTTKGRMTRGTKTVLAWRATGRGRAACRSLACSGGRAAECASDSTDMQACRVLSAIASHSHTQLLLYAVPRFSCVTRRWLLQVGCRLRRHCNPVCTVRVETRPQHCGSAT